MGFFDTNRYVYEGFNGVARSFFHWFKVNPIP